VVGKGTTTTSVSCSRTIVGQSSWLSLIQAWFASARWRPSRNKSFI
jgi:hypothetical protein